MMEFDSFIAMGGYALYVWGSYALALAGYGASMVWALAQWNRARKKAAPGK